MSIIDEAQDRRIVKGLPSVVSAVIARDVTDFNQKAFVVFPDLDPSVHIGPCKWQARDSVSLPASGDTCVVLLDNHSEPWIPCWWPAAFG